MIEPPTLIVMAKAPRVGVGKTRLAADVGRAEAWRINRALQRRTLRVACSGRWRTILCVAPDKATSLALPGVWSSKVRRVPQGRGDLGARLARALVRHRYVAVIGTDCPGISRAQIVRAFVALKRAPFALGPAHDGGFWLLAARRGREAARAMANVRWSSEHAAADVIAKLGAGNVALLETLHDIDTYEDMRAYREAIR